MWGGWALKARRLPSILKFLRESAEGAKILKLSGVSAEGAKKPTGLKIVGSERERREDSRRYFKNYTQT